MNFNHYFTNSELQAQLENWASKEPLLCSLGMLGHSHEGRPIHLLTLTDLSTGAPESKPAIWIDANIHATELAGTTVTLKIIHELVTRRRHILRNCTFYCVPRLNPDGAERAMAERPEFLRSGVRPYPFDEPEEGIHAEDLDGDGRVLQMRISDPAGDWKISTLNPRLMEKRRPDENGGQYYRLLPEGMIKDFDGYTIRAPRPLAGLDFNRNYPFQWRPEAEQIGAGPYPASEPEIRAMVDFIAKTRNICFALNYHTYGGMLLRPYDEGDDPLDAEDKWVYDRIGKRGQELTGYVHGSTHELLKYHPKETITGTGSEWIFDHFGIFAWTVEIWDLVTRSGVKKGNVMDWFREHPVSDDVKILEWYESSSGGEGYIDWYEFQHPQLGKVELGGWNYLYTWSNPPPALMGEEADRNADFALCLAEMLPRLSVHTVKSTPLGNDRFHLLLVFENLGFLPSYVSQNGKKRKTARPAWVDLILPEGACLTSGRIRTELIHLEGRSNKLNSSGFGFISTPTDHRAKTEWVITAAPGTEIEILVEGDRAGSLSLTHTLGTEFHSS